MAKILLKEKDHLRKLSTSTNGSYYKALVALLECRSATIKEALVDADDSELKLLQGKAQEIRHLLKSLKRKALKPQLNGAYR